MRRAYQVLAYLLAAEVVVQAMAIAYAIAGLDHWVEDDHGVLNKQLLDGDKLHFQGIGGFAVHGINGQLIIPVLTLALVVVSFFAKVPDGRKRAGILFGMVVVQVALGMTSGSAPLLAPLHVLNGFGILFMALATAKKVDLVPEAVAA